MALSAELHRFESPSGLGLQPRRHDHQPTFQRAGPEAVFVGGSRQPAHAAQLQQHSSEVSIKRLDQLQGQQGDQSHAAWLEIIATTES